MHRLPEGHALKPLFSRHRSTLFRLATAVVVILLSLEFLSHAEQGFDGRAVLAFLAGLGWDQVLFCLLAVAVAFFAVSRQERAVCRHLGLWPDSAGQHPAKAGAAAAALSQTVGFGPVVGAIVRHRLRPDLTLKQSFAISAGITLGFFLGLGLLVLAGFVLIPGYLDRSFAAALLIAALILILGIALWPGRGRLGLAKPNLLTTAAFLLWLCIDLLAFAAALWVLLPASATPPFPFYATAFLIALGFGLATGSPAGVGPFEATLITHLPGTDANALMAGIIAFRMLAYALPALLGAVWALVGPHLRRDAAARPAPIPPDPASLPVAEAQLSRLGELALVPVGPRSHWLGAALSQMHVALGDPMGQPAAPAALTAQITAHSRRARADGRLPCLYKTGPRTAAIARRMGHAVLPIAHEAVLDPARFTLTGPDKARLRRKLSHARKAGLLVESPAHPPLQDMAAVAQAWCAAHGAERGFSMGRWQPEYVRDQRVITARTPDGRLVAFVTFHVSAVEWTLDLVRPAPDAPDGAIYAMICAAIDLARAAGITRLSLAAAPRPDFGLTGPLAPLARRLTRSSAGLAQFKSAFAPKWEPRYMAAPNPALLLLAAAEISRAITAPAPLPQTDAAAPHSLPPRDAWPEDAADYPQPARLLILSRRRD